MTYDNDAFREYDPAEDVEEFEALIAEYGFPSDGTGHVLLEASTLDGFIDEEAQLLVLQMQAGPIKLVGALNRDETDEVINHLIDQAWQLEMLDRDDREEALEALELRTIDSDAIRDDVEEALAFGSPFQAGTSVDSIPTGNYTVLEAVWSYLDDTHQWSALAEWLSEWTEA
jgi:hypothetical protein